MDAELRRYPTYKNSGVPWLGEVPEHWGLRRGKWLFRSKKEINTDRQYTNVLSLTLRGVVNNDPDDPEGLVPRDYGTYQFFAKGDLVFKLIDLENLRTSRVGLVHEDGIMSPAYVRFIGTHGGNQRFFFQQYFDLYQRGIFNQLGAGVRSTLGPRDLLDLPVLVPDSAEQAAIVRFLGHVDGRIRRYIRAKQQLIKLLEEQKQSIIHRALTGGLDPNVHLKPSDVEWLGDVPERWEVRRLKSIVRRIDQGVSPQAENYLAEGGAWGVLKAGCVNRGVFRQTEHKRLPAGFDFAPSLAVTEGDVLVSRASGSPHLVGSVGRVTSLKYNLILSDKTFRPVFNQDVDSEFMVLAMNSRYYRQQVEQAISGAEGLANNLPLSSLRAFVFAVPALEEQRAIADYLRNSTNEVSKALAHAEREVTLLREYRTRMFADVVTGKLDVRESVEPLPDEGNQSEPLREDEDSSDPDVVVDEELDTFSEEVEA